MAFSWGTIAFIFIGYIMVYSIINRICQCVETCALSKAFAAYLAKNSTTITSFDKVAAAITNATKKGRVSEGKGVNE